ncbi:MAG: DUF6351 family protein, partial [Pseudomonadota bacterium]
MFNKSLRTPRSQIWSTASTLPILLTLAILGCGGNDEVSVSAADEPSAALPTFQITSLSSHLDKISGGSTMLQVQTPAGVSLDAVKVTLNGADVTSKLSTRDSSSRTLRGLIDGLTTNAASTTGSTNTLVVTSSDQKTRTTTAALVNFPITGPILSGSHLTPYECRTVNNGLGAALDANGNIAVSGGTFDVSSSNHQITLAGNWSKTGGTFNGRAGTVVLDGTNQAVSGDTTFYGFNKTVSAADTLTLPASAVTTFT